MAWTQRRRRPNANMTAAPSPRSIRSWPCRPGTWRRTSTPGRESTMVATGRRPASERIASSSRCCRSMAPEPRYVFVTSEPCAVTELVYACGTGRPSGTTGRDLLADQAGARGQGLHLGERDVAGQVLHPAVRGRDDVLGRHVRQGAADAVGDDLGGLDGVVAEVDDAEDDLLAGQLGEHGAVEVRLAGLDGDGIAPDRGHLGQERVAAGAVVDDGGVAEADVDGGTAADPGQRPLQRRHAVLPSLLGAGLQVRLVDLHDVGPGGEQ